MSTPEQPDWREGLDDLHRHTIATSAEMLGFEQRLDETERKMRATLPEGSPERGQQELLLVIQRRQLETDRWVNTIASLMNGLVEQFMVLDERVRALEGDSE